MSMSVSATAAVRIYAPVVSVLNAAWIQPESLVLTVMRNWWRRPCAIVRPVASTMRKRAVDTGIIELSA